MTNTVTHFEIYGEHPVAVADFYRKALGWQVEQMEGIAEIANKGLDEVLAWCVVMIAAFLPFFAMKELERAFGAEKVRGMFFGKHREGTDSPADDNDEAAKPKP